MCNKKIQGKKMGLNGVWGGAGNSSPVACPKDCGKQNQSSLPPLILFFSLIVFLLLEGAPVFAGFTMPSGTPPSGVVCYANGLGTVFSSSAEACSYMQKTYDSMNTATSSASVTNCPTGIGMDTVGTTLFTDTGTGRTITNLHPSPIIYCSGAPVCQPGTGYNTLTGMCDDVCPIDGLSTDRADPNGLEALIKKYDKTKEEEALTRQLEGGLNAYNLLTQKTKNAEKCLAGRIASELLQSDSNYTVTGTVRTLAYQAHLRKLWDKFFELKEAIRKKSSIQQLCPALIAQVEEEMGFLITQNPKKDDCTPGKHHCIVSTPANPDKVPKHADYVAFDISKSTIKKFANILLPPRTMATEANACNLTWGGTFKDFDPVHFLCCVK